MQADTFYCSQAKQWEYCKHLSRYHIPLYLSSWSHFIAGRAKPEAWAACLIGAGVCQMYGNNIVEKRAKPEQDKAYFRGHI